MTQALSQLSEALAAAVELAGRSVVRVEARRRYPASGMVWSADGVIVTAHHAIEQDDSIEVGLPDGRAVQAQLVGRDPSTDLAVLRVQMAGLTPLAQAPAEGARVGHLALALGRPGKGVRATMGIISALGDSWVTPAGGRVDRYIQGDVAMYPGFSGGPLVDAEGRLLGLNTSGLSRGSTATTIPAGTIQRVVGTLLAHGKVRRGYLGIGSQPVRLQPALAQQLGGQETGLLVISVASDSPADKAGLLVGDAVVGFAGQPVRFIDDLLTALTGAEVGSRTTVRIIRGGQLQEVAVTVGEHP
jgi:S1-C subfamily serine protease